MIRRFIRMLDRQIDMPETDTRCIVLGFLTVAGIIAMVVVFMMAVAGR